MFKYPHILLLGFEDRFTQDQVKSIINLSKGKVTEPYIIKNHILCHSTDPLFKLPLVIHKMNMTDLETYLNRLYSYLTPNK